MKVRRDISSIPLRTAEASWLTIKQLVTGKDSIDAEHFNAAASTMESLIADEVYREHPLTLAGVGPRLVIYLRHMDDALEAGELVDPLNWNPTAGDWKLYVPCPKEQEGWVKKALATRAPRFVVIEPGESIDDASDETAGKAEAMTVNWTVFNR